MRPSALAAFPGWLAQFEGDLSRPYLDVKGLPTVGLGFLCPLSTALACAWAVPSTGALATPADVHAAYEALLRLPPGKGGGWYESRVDLALSPHSAAALLTSHVLEYEIALRSAFGVGPAWDALPGVAQIARLRTSWADGAYSRWPKLDAALRAGDWDTAQTECMPSDMARQPAAYVASYRAVRALYGLAASFPGEELPYPLPDGSVDVGA